LESRNGARRSAAEKSQDCATTSTETGNSEVWLERDADHDFESSTVKARISGLAQFLALVTAEAAVSEFPGIKEW
jgi:hypothetical protein